MAWGAKTALGGALSVAGSAQTTGYITLNPGEQAHIQLSVNWPASPTDDLIVRVQSTLDAAGETADTIAIWSQTVTNDSDPDYISFLVSGVYKFRLEFERSGSSDTIEVTTNYRVDGVSM